MYNVDEHLQALQCFDHCVVTLHYPNLWVLERLKFPFKPCARVLQQGHAAVFKWIAFPLGQRGVDDLHPKGGARTKFGDPIASSLRDNFLRRAIHAASLCDHGHRGGQFCLASPAERFERPSGGPQAQRLALEARGQELGRAPEVAGWRTCGNGPGRTDRSQVPACDELFVGGPQNEWREKRREGLIRLLLPSFDSSNDIGLQLDELRAQCSHEGACGDVDLARWVLRRANKSQGGLRFLDVGRQGTLLWPQMFKTAEGVTQIVERTRVYVSFLCRDFAGVPVRTTSHKPLGKWRQDFLIDA
mmetsp:Transcript_101326/g.285759  ORF Transcript_101326/g.285759 Transcript_101326/m.285759 type:complete len:302 (-) Transcript_101326:1609-2514(-)